MVFWKGWSWEVQTGAMRHSRGSDQEASLSSLSPGPLRDALQGHSGTVALLSECEGRSCAEPGGTSRSRGVCRD